MKTTTDLPDDRVQRIQRHAVMRNQNLKDAIAQLLARALEDTPAPGKHQEVPQPLAPKQHGP